MGGGDTGVGFGVGVVEDSGDAEVRVVVSARGSVFSEDRGGAADCMVVGRGRWR